MNFIRKKSSKINRFVLLPNGRFHVNRRRSATQISFLLKFFIQNVFFLIIIHCRLRENKLKSRMHVLFPFYPACTRTMTKLIFWVLCARVYACVFVRTRTARLNLCHFVNEFSEKILRISEKKNPLDYQIE
jgi:hypothetical protein